MMDDRLRSIRVTSNNEVFFYDYIKNNFTEYFFFHVDYAQYPESTEIYMALDNEEKIQGMVLIWKNRRIQLRGKAVSLEFLLKGKSYNPISITGFDNHKKLISKFFPNYKKEIALYRMGLKKGDHKDFEKYKFQKLNESYREEITSLMRIADPIFWSNPEDIVIDENNIWYGITKKKDLICIVGLWNYESIGYIVVVGTHPDYWNQGYASSLISSTLKELFQDKDKVQCLIQVRVANSPAIHTYKKLGFSIRNTQYSYERL